MVQRLQNRRQQRVGGEILRILSIALAQREIMVSITQVEMSPDLRHAFVYISAQVGAPVFEQLNRYRTTLQYELAQSVMLRFTPLLHFECDQQWIFQQEVENLLKASESDLSNEERDDDWEKDDAAPVSHSETG